MLKKILIGLVALIAVFVVVVAMQPDDFRIERSATIDAPPDQVFAQVNDFHNWEKWSPWRKLDPNAKSEYSGAKSGVGAKFSWAGNSDVGVGSMTLTESKPHERIGIQLDFKEPFEDSSDVEFIFKPEGNKTHVTWAISGQDDFIFKAFSLVMDRDGMIGDMYEKGLKSLEEATKAAATQ